MSLLILEVRTKVEWIKDIARAPVVGGVFLFLLMFIPAAVVSFILQAIIPGLHDDVGFTKSMLFLLPTWNLILWLIKIRLYCIFLPSWILFGVIAFIKGILLIAGIDDGQ